MKENKDIIKNRMIKKAASLWGVPANEIEISFDPVVTLLLSACAAEIEKINEKLDESQIRVTEKIIQLMTPEVIYGPKPSHCIIKTEAEEDSVTITPDFLFSYKKKEVEKASKKFRDVFFNPIEDFKIVKGEIQYLAYGNTITELSTDIKEQNILIKTNEDFINKSTIYIGITSNVKSLELKNTSIYFEIQDFNKSKLFYHHLKNAKWFTLEKEIKVKYGTVKNNDNKVLNVTSEENTLKLSTIIEQVRNNYNRNYITINQNFNTRKDVPSEIETIAQTHRVKLEENVTWLKLVFPSIVDKTFFESVFCSLNTFPAINRKKEEFSFQLNEFINIVPVKSNSLFLDIKSITNLEGELYKTSNNDLSSEKKGTYTIKKDNISKLDNRNAKEYINRLIELLKSESAAFSYLNNSFLNNNLKKLNQIISLLETKVNSDVELQKKETNFISVVPYKTQDTLLVEYWTTDGLFANNIKYGSALKNYKTVGLKQKKTSILTSTHGGRNALNMEERLQAYRRTLLSRNKIVTKEDVRLICFEFFGDKITDVIVKNSYTVDISLHKGMINCIEIQLISNPNKEIIPHEWDYIQNNLLLYLEKKSTAVFPFIIKKV